MATHVGVENFFQTTITGGTIPSSGNFTMTLGSPPDSSAGFLVLSPSNALLREVVFYSSVSGNDVTVLGENRYSPKAHSIGEEVKMNTVAELFDYMFQNISDAFYLEKTGGLNVKVYGGYVTYNNAIQSVADTNLTMTNDAVNYITYTYNTNLIAVETSDSSRVRAVVTTVGGVITNITYRQSKESYLDYTVTLTGALPSQGGNTGKVLLTNGTNVYWGSTGDATTTVRGLTENATSGETAQGVFASPYSITPAALAEIYYFGDGSDGDVTISGGTSLTRDMYYNNLTVNTGITLDPAGYAIYVLGTLTLSGTAKIARNGNAGAVNIGGVALATGTCGPCLGGSNGASGTAGVAGNNGTNGTAVATSYKTTGNSAAGGNGGAGINAGGTGGTAAAHTQGALYNKVYTLPIALQRIAMPTRVLTAFTQYGGLASSGSGGSGGSTGTGTGGTGGGSGGNGGIIVIFAHTLAGTGTIEAPGGNGGAGSNGGGSNQGGGGGGGAGGCGGVVVLTYRTGTPWTIILTGGTGGTGGTGANGGANGIAGSNGTTGQSIILQV